MSLKSLLAVGETFSGTDSTVAAAAKEGQEQIDFAKQRETPVKIGPERRQIEPPPQERRRLLDRNRRGSARTATQAEMSLDQVRVVRNDLSDSDLELAPRRASRSAQTDFNPFAPRPIAAIGRPTHEKLSMGTRVARWFRFLKKPRS